MDVQFGQFSGQAGTLVITHDFNVTVMHLDLVFEDRNKTLAVDLNSSISVTSHVAGMNLSRRVAIEG